MMMGKKYAKKTDQKNGVFFCTGHEERGVAECQPSILPQFHQIKFRNNENIANGFRYHRHSRQRNVQLF